MGTLFLVATPIGNLEDITARALRVLREAALIAAEDTRHTRRLLTHFDIHTPVTSYFEHNKLQKLETVVEALAQGDVALVSDAGTPAISDPGYELVRAALAAGFPVTAIPGPSALLTALVASGLPTDAFLYLGFLPRKDAERRRLLESVAGEPRTLVAYEAPHRLLDTLAEVRAVLGNRPLAVARELTKLHEEIYRGAAALPVERWEAARVQAELARLLSAGLKRKDAARRVAEPAGWSAREVYNLPAVDH